MSRDCRHDRLPLHLIHGALGLDLVRRANVGVERFVRELPFLGVLLKKEQDVETFAQAKRGGSWRN